MILFTSFRFLLLIFLFFVKMNFLAMAVNLTTRLFKSQPNRLEHEFSLNVMHEFYLFALKRSWILFYFWHRFGFSVGKSSFRVSFISQIILLLFVRKTFTTNIYFGIVFFFSSFGSRSFYQLYTYIYKLLVVLVWIKSSGWNNKYFDFVQMVAGGEKKGIFCHGLAVGK